MQSKNEIDIQSLLEKIDPLIQTMHYVKMDVALSPIKEHLITSIKYQGLNQMRKEFIQRLTSSIVKYVISKTKYKSTKEELKNDGFDERDTDAEIFQQAAGYFRKSDIKGQFSELLLFNFLQYYFEAIPVVRKMIITTNTELERNGADAIHLGVFEAGGYCVYLGEAKTYPSGFVKAFQNSIQSIINAYSEHRNELQLHSYADFVEPSVRELMKNYLSGKIELPVKLVIVISYCVGNVPEQETGDKYNQYYIQHVLNECSKINDNHYKSKDKKAINPGLLKEIHYILFPINELDKLLADFQVKLGNK